MSVNNNELKTILEKILNKPFLNSPLLQELAKEKERQAIFLASNPIERIGQNVELMQTLLDMAKKMDPFHANFVRIMNDKNATIGDMNAAAIGCALLGQITQLGKFRNRKDLPKATKDMILDGTMELGLILSEELFRKGLCLYFVPFLEKYANNDEFFKGIKVAGEVKGLRLMVDLVERRFKKCQPKLNDKRLAALENIFLEEIAKIEKNEKDWKKVRELEAIANAKTPFISERVKEKARAILFAKVYASSDHDIVNLLEFYRFAFAGKRTEETKKVEIKPDRIPKKIL